MCGILGYAGPEVEQERHAFEAALDLLAHRGPDDRGVFGSDGVLLGHRRLSIIDLSTAGHQPMVDDDSGAVVTYNGEIYNYLELRGELESLGHRFSSATDTEVLLKAYLEWGPDCLRRFNGMWAFAIWVPSRQTLFCARDRFGVKPFYLWQAGSAIAFASEPKAILALRPESRRVNQATLAAFLGRRATVYRRPVLLPGHPGVPAGPLRRVVRGDGDIARLGLLALPERAGRGGISPTRDRSLHRASG